MIDGSPFSSLDHATFFARQLWFKESRIQSWLDAFSEHRHLTRAIGHVPTSMMKNCFNGIEAREEFKLIEHGIERLWGWLSRSQIQEASEEPGEVVPYSMEKKDVSSDGSDEADSVG
ncbi:uncharacterized protein DS421_16g550680 [Arachis hypogaea]|nr:uncharacterized protein DS421_16g550680 [Arachis hypogaea]